MGLFGIVGGLLETGVSAVLTPVGMAGDLLDRDSNMSTTKQCLHGIARGTGKTISSTIRIVSDPFDEDGDDDW